MKVHALNILRALFKDARLGEDVAPYICQGLQAAILGFKSQFWEVSNISCVFISLGVPDFCLPRPVSVLLCLLSWVGFFFSLCCPKGKMFLFKIWVTGKPAATESHNPTQNIDKAVIVLTGIYR